MWQNLGPALDLAAALSAAFNAAYFIHYLLRQKEMPSRRLAASALAVVSLGALVESLFFLAFLALPPTQWPLRSLPWSLARSLSLAGSAFISLLILRRVVTIDT